MKKKYFILILILFFTIPFNIKALTINRGENESATNLVKRILGDSIEITSAKKKGTIYTFDNGYNYFGISSGIILDTSGEENEEESYVDNSLQNLLNNTNNVIISSYNNLSSEDKETVGDIEELKALYDEENGGHTSLLEFELVANGNLLNFNYAFASTEFNQSPQYNDIFGLFVSVNGSGYENISTIKRNDESLVPVSISTLRSGLSGKEMLNGLSTDLSIKDNHTLFRVNDKENDYIEYNGISSVFNASKKVNIGDKIKIKLVIADATDDSYDSYVFIEAESLSFSNKIKNPNTEDNIYMYLLTLVIAVIITGIILFNKIKK